MLGIAYSYKWLGGMLAYRHLYYDQKGDKLVQDVRFSGPAADAEVLAFCRYLGSQPPIGSHP